MYLKIILTRMIFFIMERSVYNGWLCGNMHDKEVVYVCSGDYCLGCNNICNKNLMLSKVTNWLNVLSSRSCQD